MARIPEQVVERLKTEVSVQRLAEAPGVNLTRHGADLHAVIIGQDPSTGAWFYGGRIGIGIDAGISFDPDGKRPGAERKSSCDGAGTTVGTFGDYGVNAGPLQYPIEQFGGGIDITSGKTYSEGPTLGSPTITLGTGKGFDVGGSFGIQVIGHN